MLRREAVDNGNKMITQQRSEASADTETTRRYSPRVEVLKRIHGEPLTRDVKVALLNMSLGGFLMQAPIDFHIGAVDEFRFTTLHGKSVALSARVVHTLHVSAGDRGSYY